MQTTKTKKAVDAVDSKPESQDDITRPGIPAASWVLLAIGSARDSCGLASPLPDREKPTDKPD